MKHLKILYPLLLILVLSASFVACSDDDDNNPFERVTNFEVPTLSADNTIQFEVNVLDASTPVLLNIRGEKVAVDWGDDNVVKDNLEENRGDTNDDRNAFQHKFQSVGKYTVKVWSTQLIELTLKSYNVGNTIHSYDKLQFGSCPILEEFYVEDLDMTELIFPSISSLKKIGLHDMVNLISLNLSNLSKLETLNMSDLNKLATLDLSNNTNLYNFHSNNLSALSTIQLKNNKDLAIFRLTSATKLSTLDCKEMPNLEYLYISLTPLINLDVTDLAQLRNLYYYSATLSTLDLSKNTELFVLGLAENGITSLDISKNTKLKKIICAKNKLTSLDVSKNQGLELIDLRSNLLNAESLNAIFTALPQSKNTRMDVKPNFSGIAVYDNLGYADCKRSIIENKGWIIKETPAGLIY